MSNERRKVKSISSLGTFEAECRGIDCPNCYDPVPVADINGTEIGGGRGWMGICSCGSIWKVEFEDAE